MPDGVTLLVFSGGQAHSAVEQMMLRAWRAVTADILAMAQELGAFDRIILVTDSPGLADNHRQHGELCVELTTGRHFHFGEELLRLVRSYRVERPLYLGGGTGVLMTPQELAGIRDTLLGDGPVVVANNLFSADIVGFSPGAAIERIEPPDTDNDLAYRLHRGAGLPFVALPRTAGTLFDVDTPTDLMVLRLQLGRLGEHIREYVAGLDLDCSRLRAACDVMKDPGAEVLVAGRVGSAVMARLERDMAARSRVYSEERGLRASGREERGEVRSLLGCWVQANGARSFFETLAGLSQAAFVDSRVIFDHLGLRLSAADRFNSDLMRAEEVSDPVAREFTAAGREAAIPVVLGGHSLVSGGLWTLLDMFGGKSER